MMRVLGVAVCAMANLVQSPADARADASCGSNEASRDYDAARAAFDRRSFDESLTLLRKAYGCDPNPVYLGNVARVYEEEGRPRDALSAWRDYLAVIHDERERTQVEGRVSALGKVVQQLDDAERDKAAAEARLREESNARAAAVPTRHPVSPFAWALTGTGAAGLITGIVLGAVAQSRRSEAEQAKAVGPQKSDESQAAGFAEAANWSWVLGGAIAAGGVLWIGIDLLGPGTADPAAKGGSARGGKGITVGGVF